jgi:proline dehydrogenase
MLRFILIYLSKACWARNIVQKFPYAKKIASRFVAGESLDQAIEAVKELNKRGINTTLDHLGENVTTTDDAIQAADEILYIIERLRMEGVSSGVSIKLSQIGLIIDENICQQNLGRILDFAQDQNIFIRIDMEDSTLTEKTIEVFLTARTKISSHLVGIAIQAYLYRSESDVRELLKKNAGIRLCKGAYKEPHGIAFPRKKDVDLNYDLITEIMLQKSQELGSALSPDGIVPPLAAIATHDEDRINHALKIARSIGLDKDGLEIQMLYGIRADLQEKLVQEGYPVRVYVPYGTEWYPYFVRRLAERPANLWFFVSNLLRS